MIQQQHDEYFTTLNQVIYQSRMHQNKLKFSDNVMDDRLISRTVMYTTIVNIPFFLSSNHTTT